MAIQYFVPDVWAAGILGALDRALVYGGLCNRDYEGEITAFGDTVHITGISDPTISDYTRNTDLSAPEALTDAEQLLIIDQAKSFNFQVDDLDAAQVRNGGALMTEATQRAGFGLRNKADLFMAARMALGATPLGIVDATTATNVYDKLLVPARVKLDQADVPPEGRWIVLDPASHGQLTLDARFIKANEAGNADTLRNGYVGRAGGFDVYLSNNAPQANRSVTITASTTTSLTAAAGTFNQGDIGLTVAGGTGRISAVTADGSGATMNPAAGTAPTVGSIALTGGGQLAIAGSRMAATFAQQILKVEGYRPEKRFADALKGLYVYGGKVTRPTALVTASVKVA